MSSTDFAHRLDRLERENRLWRRGVALSAVLTGVVVLAASTSDHAPKVLEGEKLVLTDSAGKTRLRFEVEDGIARLDLLGTDGKPHARLAMEEDIDAHLSFFHPESHEELLRLGVKPNTYQKAPYVEMTGEAKSGLTVAAAGQNGPHLVLKDMKGNDVFMLGLPADEPGRDRPYAMFLGGAGKPLHIGYGKDGHLSMSRIGGKEELALPPRD